MRSLHSATVGGSCGAVVLGLVFGLAGPACSSDESAAADDAGGSGDAVASSSSSSGAGGSGGLTDSGAVEGGSGGSCTIDAAGATFGITAANPFASVVNEQTTSLPVNARANSGRIHVDACGIHVLASLDGNYGIHTALPGGVFTQLSSNTLAAREIKRFTKIGGDFAILSNDNDNKTYLRRMPATGGEITKVLGEPLIDGDFGAMSFATSATHLFFVTYDSGPRYDLRRAPIGTFSTGTIPLDEPLANEAIDLRNTSVFTFGAFVGFGVQHFYAQDCVAAAGAGCQGATIASPPSLDPVFASQNDTLYGYSDGFLMVRKLAETTTWSNKPAGTDTTNASLVASSVAPDGSRLALLTRSPVHGFQLQLIVEANTATPRGTTVNVPGDGDSRDVWTNGKVAIVVSENSGDTKPLAIRGVAFP